MKTLFALGLMATLALGASAQSCRPHQNAYNTQNYNNQQYRTVYTPPYNTNYTYNYGYSQPYNPGYYNNAYYNNGYYTNGYYNNGYYQPTTNNLGANLAGGLINAVLSQVIR